MVMSASSVVALDEYGSSWYFVAAPGGVGGGRGRGARGRGPHRLPPLAAAGRAARAAWRSGCSALVLVPASASGNGATRWIGVGPLTFQPSELAKLAVLLWVADLLARRAAYMHNTRATLRPVIVVLGRRGHAGHAPAQPRHHDRRRRHRPRRCASWPARRSVPLAGWATFGLAAAVALALAAPYRRARVLAFLDPWADPMDKGYQNIQSLVGLAVGRASSASGLGASRAKWGFLPYAHSDFIFAIIGEELGLVGATVVVGLFVAARHLGVRIALHAPDRFGLLLAVGVTAWFCVQAFVNIGAVIGILPITGVPLPFVSAGGSSLVFGMAGAGLLLSVARQATDRCAAALASTGARRRRGR